MDSRKTTDLSIYTFGKVPPQAREIEEVVLGAMMLERDAVSLALSILRNSEMFYISANRLVHSAIVNLFTKNSVVDILTVTEELKKMGKLEEVGGAFYVTELTSRIASAANIEHHALIIREKWVARECIRIGSGIIRRSYEDTDEPMEVLGDAVDGYSNLLNQITTGNTRSFQNKVDEVFSQIANAVSLPAGAKNTAIGYTTGNKALDAKMRYKKSNLIVLSGRPGHGKTSLEVEGMLRNAVNGIPVGCFSLEMSASELIQKLISAASGVEVEKIASGVLNDAEQLEVSNARDLIRELPINIYDRGEEDGVTMRDIAAIAKGWKAMFKTEIFFIDYMQLIVSGNENKKFSNREQDVSDISRSCKRLAKRLDAPVVAISALSRNLEKRTNWDKRPQDADLREGGSIEYDADVIVHLFRPENVGLEFYTNDGTFNDGASVKNTVELDVTKNKLGTRGRIRQHIDNATGRLSEWFPHKSEWVPPSNSAKSQRNYYEKDTNDDDDRPF